MTSNRFCVLLYSTLLFVLFAICPARVIIYVLVHHVWPLFPAANREASLHAHGRHLNDRFPRLGGGVRRDGVWAETNSDPMFETYNTNVTLDVTDE